MKQDFPGGSGGKESACNAGHLDSIPGLGRSSGEGKGYPLQYSGLENPMDCIVHGVTKSWTQLSDSLSLSSRGFLVPLHFLPGFPCGSAGKESDCNAGDLGSIPGSGRSPGEGNATRPSILAWRAPRQRSLVGYDPRVTKSQIALSN